MSDDINPLFGLPAWVGDEDHPLTTWPTYGGIDRNQDLESVKSIAERTGIADEVRPRLEDYASIPVVPPAVYEFIRRALDEAKAGTQATPAPSSPVPAAPASPESIPQDSQASTSRPA